MMIGTLTHPRSQYPAREQVDVPSPKAKPSDRRGVGMLARPRTFRPGMRRGSMRVEHEPLTTVSDPDRSFLGWYPWTLSLAQVMIADRR